MKITKIETIRVGEFPRVLWLRVHTDEGQIGLGETFYGARTAEAAVHELFVPLLLGRDPFEIERHWYNMFRLADHWGYGGAELRAISAIDTALWDVAGQALDRPIYDLLGGASRDRIRVYETGGGPDYQTNPVPYVKELLEMGISAMKVGAYPLAHTGDGYDVSRGEIERVVAPIRTIAAAVGDEMRIAVDGHGFWSLHAASQIAQALEPYPILWLEEMLSPRNVDAHLTLARDTRIPICLSERFVTRYQFREFIERGAAEIVMPDLVWTGGISETKKIAILAETYQLPVCPHDCTGPVNLFACAHICMNIPNAMLMETLRPFLEGWYRQVLSPAPSVVDGYLLAPEGPGLGTQLRSEVLQRSDASIQVSDEPRPHYLGWRH